MPNTIKFDFTGLDLRLIPRDPADNPQDDVARSDDPPAQSPGDAAINDINQRDQLEKEDTVNDRSIDNPQNINKDDIDNPPGQGNPYH